PARADIVLSGAAFTGTDSTGVGPIGYGTTTAPGGYTLFMANGALSSSPSYLNTAKSTPDLNVALTAGSHTISGYMDYGGLAYGATSLFFGGSDTAGISVYASQTDSLGSVPEFAADGNRLMSVTGSDANGADSLAYDNGIQTVTLTNYVLASTTLISDLGVPQVGPSALSGSGPTIGFEMTLVVTNDDATVPEPSSMALIVPAIVGLLAWRRSRRFASGAALVR
ncbi:MAG: PEP-CTERM sorting domain-containing protein, partial [Acetobacteraceae bacterium]